MSVRTHVRYPQGKLLLRDLDKKLPVIDYGKGVHLYDRSGKQYIDAVSGAFVVSVGHGNEDVLSTFRSQISRVAYVNGMQFTNVPAELLAEKLAAKGEKLELSRSAFLSSGSEAVECAIKFARQLWVERGKPERTKLLARVPSYHGNTIFALSASGRPHYKKIYGPLLSEVVTVSAPYEYRFEGDYQKNGAATLLKQLEITLQREGADRIFAFILEPIIGSSAGGSLPPPGYFEGVQKLCRQYGILLIADEVLCGTGRTGTFFASESVGLRPDILVLGKGINGGYAPLSVVMVREDHLAEMKQGSGKFLHAQTYMHSPCMAAAGLAVMEYMENHQLCQRSQKMGEILHQQLHERFGDHPNVGNITGKGLLAGIEWVSNKEKKTPFPRSEKFAERVVEKGFEEGLTLWPNVGQADGIQGDLTLIAPPLTISESEMEDLLGRLAVTFGSF